MLNFEEKLLLKNIRISKIKINMINFLPDMLLSPKKKASRKEYISISIFPPILKIKFIGIVQGIYIYIVRYVYTCIYFVHLHYDKVRGPNKNTLMTVKYCPHGFS